MFLVSRAAARAESCVMRSGAKRSKLQIRAQIKAETRAEKRQLLCNDPRSACPR